MIKDYSSLSVYEKNLVVDFINRNEKDKESLEDIEKNIKTKVYDYGKGVIFYFQGEKVLGKVSVVLEVAEILNVVYIHFIDILDDIEKKEVILGELITRGELIANKYNANKVLLGIRDEKLLEIAGNIGLYSEYSSFNMILEKKEGALKPLKLINLSKENLSEYVNIYNKSFMDMPHGTYIDSREANEKLDKMGHNNEYFIVSHNGVNIGFMDIEIKDSKGFFDIGLCKEHRGKGYGKRLLETAISYLNKKSVEKICLTVIEKNTIAYDMYKNRGFKVYSKISDWIEIKK